MARKSRKQIAVEEPVIESVSSEVFSTAIYARLSVENSGKSEKVDVIANQIEICKSYIAERPYLNLIDTYVDNGRTGTVFDRPEFNRLMNDIRTGRIKCLVVRDLSRFGRDYIEAGTYLERVFPQIGLRFIAIKENYDNFDTDGSGESLIRKEHKRELEYEKFDGYELPPRTQFSMLNKPAVSIKYGVMKFNMACIRLFEGIKYVLPILHPNKKRLALIMCPEEDSASVEWARQKDENWVNKDITSLEFVENIFRLMNWNRECRYKVLGRVANSDQGLCMLFDLEEAIMFTPKPQEYTDPLTGEMKKKQMKFFPDTYRNRIGKSYNDYIADHQMNMFEDFIGYQGSAVLGEPVREEDSFSKESMSQESEISENILLPDLAKQSESIEQQSGEIAERGMPT